MNDQPQTIPAGLTRDEARAVREWALHALNKPGASTTAEKAVARVVLGTVPEPRPTLADMTTEERNACRRMQADVKGRDRRPVIIHFYWGDETARVMWPHGFIEEIDWEHITPRPDLPRLEWPAGDQGAEPEPEPAPALPAGWRIADHDVYGRVVVTTQTPNSAGNVYFVYPEPADQKGHYWHLCAPDRLTYIDTEPEEA